MGKYPYPVSGEKMLDRMADPDANPFALRLL